MGLILEPDLIKKMLVVTSNRGPDNTDFFETENYTVGHNRLAIIDPDIRSINHIFLKNMFYHLMVKFIITKKLKKTNIKGI